MPYTTDTDDSEEVAELRKRVEELEAAMQAILHETTVLDYEGNFGAIRRMAKEALHIDA